MERLLFHIERMTQLRDRGELEVALIEALCELCGAGFASYHRLLMPPGDILVSLVATVDAAGTHLHDDGLTLADDLVSIECFPHLHSCLQQHAPCHDQDPDTGLSRLCLPVPASGEVYGFITLAGDDAISGDDPRIAGLISIFGNQRSLLDYAEVDTLTQLLNRKTFDEKILRILSRIGNAGDIESGALHLPHRRQPRPEMENHWLGVIDIDHFKRINDNFGHLIGDEVLILLANMMRACFRTQDLLFRFGGEEFVVLLKPTESLNALRAFERFREMVAAFSFPQVGHMTISTGVARIGPSDTPSVIFENADDALYWAKEHGRNQVCSYEQLVLRGELPPREVRTSELELF